MREEEGGEKVEDCVRRGSIDEAQTNSTKNDGRNIWPNRKIPSITKIDELFDQMFVEVISVIGGGEAGQGAMLKFSACQNVDRKETRRSRDLKELRNFDNLLLYFEAELYFIRL